MIGEKFGYWEELHYDAVSRRYIALPPSIQSTNSGFIFAENKFHEGRFFNLSFISERVRVFDVMLYNQSVIFTLLHQAHNSSLVTAQLGPDMNVIHYQPHHDFDAKHKILNLVEQSKPNIADRCVMNECTGADNFCIPNTMDSYVCSFNVSRMQYRWHVLIRIPVPPPQTSKIYAVQSAWLDWLYMLVALALALALIALLVFLWKSKKVSFYQIRLKSVSRVNSSKLPHKNNGSREIAE